MSRVGINSSILWEFGGKFWLEEIQPDFVELSLAELHPEKWDEAVEKVKEYDLTIHAPYQNSPVEVTRIDLARNIGIKTAEKVLKFAEKVNAEAVVFHCGDVFRNCEDSLNNVIKNLKELEKRTDVEILVENLYRDESGICRVGETPTEMLQIVESCKKVSVNIDIGHAYLSSLLIKNFEVNEFFKKLNGSIRHMHAHNNFGIWTIPYDEHNPIFRGLINYAELRKYIRRLDRIVLEIKRGSLEEIVQSMSFLKNL